MVPFEETIKTKQELIEACKQGFEDYSNKRISKNDFCMYFGFTHGQAITTFYKGNYEQLLIDGGFKSGSVAYFSGGINAWKNLRDGKYVFPPLVQATPRPFIINDLPSLQIFYGAPGTGKSHTIKEEEKILDKDNVFRTTFHPDSDYASFVGAYKPTMSEVDTKVVPVVFSEKGTTFEKDSTIKENKIVYEFVPQVFLKAYIRAWQIWRGTTPSPETPKSVIESTTFGEIKVTIDGVTICEGKTMAESGLVLVEEYIKTRGGATSKDIVSEWNGIGIGSPDFRLLNEDADLTKKETWPKININGETYLFVKEIHAKLWKKFCEKTKELFKKYGKGVIIEDIEKPRKKKASDSSLVSPDESISQTVLLVIEEINRGNCAQIFGDIFQLLDRGDGFSEYPIVPDKDISDFVRKEFERLSVSFTDEQINLINEHFDNKDVATEILNGKVLVLPPNLFIWATMNTSDQSLFPIDSAFKRRWEWKYIPIGYENKDWIIKIGDKTYKWVDFQRTINDKIYFIDNSEDKQLGDFFVDANRTGKIISADTLLNKILFYIWNDVCKDDPDQIFRWIDYKDKKEKSIRFSDFFTDDKDKKLQGLMSFLGVKAEG